ncbi:class I SAM-dependent methyltransferase [Paraburkholderia strydomiana]|uniref:class I SAM-dependent methyltransferase n=1 Tax=Paraburkholderia strydomiana TaxID=1245417 RepID=UPI0038BBD5E3
MTEQIRQDLIGAIEGYYLVSIIDFFHYSGVLEALKGGRPMEAISADFGYDVVTMNFLATYVRRRTCDVMPSQDTGQPVENHSPSVDWQFIGHLLDQYVGAFGPCIGALDRVVVDPKVGAQRIDWVRHARAFAGADRGAANRFPLRLLAQLGVDRVIDLGCGSGGFLLDFVEGQVSARAWGLDSNPAAIDAGRRAAHSSCLEGRVTFLVGDVCTPATHIDAETLDTIQVITAFNVANAFFGADPAKTIGSWLAAMRSTFPNRLLLMGDYYGRLNACDDPVDHRFRRTLFHDVAQLLTGQGVPPVSVDAWREILRAAGCTLVKAFEGEHDEVAHFVYLIQL